MAVQRKNQGKPRPESYRKRSYRRAVHPADLISFEVRVRETDLHILAGADLSAAARHAVIEQRNFLESYIAAHPRFLTALIPLAADPLAPPIVKEMLAAGERAGVGPMAAVAGAMAEFVGKALQKRGAGEVIVENGGDIYLARRRECTVGIFAGASPLSNRLGVKIPAVLMPLGVCTSSGTVGHSLSLGEADSVTVLASSVSLADAVATRLGNEVKKARDINRALAVARRLEGVLGVVVIRGEQLGAWGQVELAPLS